MGKIIFLFLFLGRCTDLYSQELIPRIGFGSSRISVDDNSTNDKINSVRRLLVGLDYKTNISKHISARIGIAYSQNGYDIPAYQGAFHPQVIY